MKACCGFGHRMVLADIEVDVYSAVLTAVQEGCAIFYTGAMGDFDTLFSVAVRRVKVKYPLIKLICVKPYLTNDLNTNKDYYAALYDDILIPTACVGVYHKAAITVRNRWIVDNSDQVISYIIRDFGGAADAVNYARKQNKPIVSLAK